MEPAIGIKRLISHKINPTMIKVTTTVISVFIFKILKVDDEGLKIIPNLNMSFHHTVKKF